MKKAAIYVRVSTQNQEKEETIENQKIEIKKRIIEDGNTLHPDFIYEDNGWSGSLPKRPGLDKLRTDASDNKFEVVYVYDRGRIARKYVLQEIIIDEIRSHGVQITSLHDITGESSEERLVGGVMGLYHEFERYKITERMRIGKLRKVKENGILLGYQPKYGYDYHPKEKSLGSIRNGYFSINDEQAEVVRYIFDLASSGKSKYYIREMLAKKQIMPPKCKRMVWSTGTLDRLLKDTTYYGAHYYNKSESVETKKPLNPENKYRRVAKGSRVVRPKDEWMLVEVPAIITKQQYEKTQQELSKNKKFSSRNTRHSYLLQGLVYCECGYSRTGECVNSNNKYYRCTDRLNNSSGTRKCYRKGVNTDNLDALVWNNLKCLLTQPELITQQVQRWQLKESPLLAEKDKLLERKNELLSSEIRYSKMYGEGVMSEQVYRNNMGDLQQSQIQLSKELGSIDEALNYKPTLPLETILDDVVKLVETLDLSDNKIIVRKLVTKVVATQEEVKVWGLIPLLSKPEVGLNAEHRYRRSSKCRQINPIQRTDK